MLALVILLSWSGIAFSQADEDTGRMSERARPAEEVIWEEENAAGEEMEEHVRRIPPGEHIDWKRTERNKSYYEQELNTKTFDKEKYKEATKDINYLDDVYEKKEEKQTTSNWDGLPHFSLGGGAFLKVLMFALIIVALALILYKMFGGSFTRNAKVGDSEIFSIEDIEDRLHESDLDKALREALQRGDFRLAVRIYYLAIIKELSIKDWIRWKKDKTNREYLNEMIAHKPDLYNGFRDATVAFERVWYGDIEIRENEYKLISPRFSNFMDSINRPQ